MNELKIAIYARKSVSTEKGESISNQIATCKNYAETILGAETNQLVIYQDDGFSGKNLVRPQFQKMLSEIEKGGYSHIVCYRLDRVSRSVADFSGLLKELQDLNVDFISVKEQFDTSSPTSKAMMYISAVFAEMERETIRERVVDNMTSLTSTGRFLGGKAPDGYIKQSIEEIDPTGKKKRHNILVVNKERAEQVQDIFKKYLEWQSIKKIETYYSQHSIYNHTGYAYKCISLRRILTNPCYCTADEQAYNYFEELGCKIMMPKSAFDGKYGITVYMRHKMVVNKRNKKQAVEKLPEEWLIYVGYHQPLVTSSDYIKTQEIISQRRSLSIRKPIGVHGILSGMLRCGNCGDYMRPSNVAQDENGAYNGKRFYYICENKSVSARHNCNIKNIRGDKFDLEIIDRVERLLNDDNDIIKSIKNSNSKSPNIGDIEKQKRIINTEISKKQLAISNLIMKIATADEIVQGYISKQVAELDKDIKELEFKLKHIDEQETINNKERLEMERIENVITKIKAGALRQEITVPEDMLVIRNTLKEIIDTIVWDGKTATINFKKL